MQHVEDWMTRDPTTIAPGASALEAIEQLVEGGFRHLPVVSSASRLVGIVALDDLRAALPSPVGLQPLSPEERSLAREYCVDELMTYLPSTVTPETPLETAARTLVERRIGCLPVVDATERLVGLLTVSDALIALAELLERGPGDRPRPPSPLEELVEALREERDRILEELQAHDSRARERVGPSSAEPGNRGLASGRLADRAAQRVRDIQRALDRHARGELGTCAHCGGTLPLSRLRALPGTDCCARCTERIASEEEPGSDDGPG